MVKVSVIFDRTISFLAFLAGVLIIFMMLAVGTEVITRYFFNQPLMGLTEIIEITLLYITFLGTAWLLKKEGHVKMDIVISRLKPRTQALANFVTSIIGVVICLAIAWYGAKVTWDHFHTAIFETPILEIPDAYVLVIIPIGSFLLFIQFLRRTFGYLELWRAS